MNKEKLEEKYYNILNEVKGGFGRGLLGGAGSILGPLGIGVAGAALYDVLLGGGPDLSSGNVSGAPFATSSSQGGLRRGLDKDRAIELGKAFSQGEEARRTAQIGTTGRERAAARNIAKGALNDLKRKATKTDASGKTVIDTSLLTPEELAKFNNLKTQYKQTEIGEFNLQTQPRVNYAAQTIGRLNQRGVNTTRPPRSADEAQLRADAMDDIAAEDAELAAQGKKFTGYEDRGQMYDAFGRRGFGVGVGKSLEDKYLDAADVKTLGFSTRGMTQEQIKAALMKKYEEEQKKKEREVRLNPKKYGIGDSTQSLDINQMTPEEMRAEIERLKEEQRLRELGKIK